MKTSKKQQVLIDEDFRNELLCDKLAHNIDPGSNERLYILLTKRGYTQRIMDGRWFKNYGPIPEVIDLRTCKQ